jgi:hypothetical protein
MRRKRAADGHLSRRLADADQGGRGAVLRRGHFEVAVTLGLPVDMMTVVPLDDKYAAKLELRFAASDRHGGSSAGDIPIVRDAPRTPAAAGGPSSTR